MADRKRKNQASSSRRADGEPPQLPEPPPFDPDLSLIGDMERAETPSADDER